MRARSPDSQAGTAPPMDLHEVSRVRAAAGHARRAVPGALGALAARELTAYADLGYCGAPDALLPELVRQMLALPAVRVPAESLPTGSPP